MRNECSIVRDLLPLYVENMVSDDTASFIAEHLESCSACREEMSKLEKSAEMADMGTTITTSYINQTAPLKAIKKRLRRRQILTMLLSFVVAAVLIGSVVSVLFLWGVPTTSENIKLETEFQYDKYAYLNREFVLHITQMTDKPLSTSVKSVYQTDGDGNYVYDAYGHKIIVGYEITVREIPFGNDPNNFTIGYGYDDNAPPDEDFDFTITVKFKDTTVTYSMAEEGLFVPQNGIR